MSSAEPNEDKAKPQESPGVCPNLGGSAHSSGVRNSPVSPGAPTSPVTLAALEETVYVILGHGAYQRRFLQCCAVGATLALMQYLAYLLIGQRVDHWCQPPDELAHLPADEWKNMSIPIDADGNYSQCTVYTMSSLSQDEEHGKKAIESCYKWDYNISDWRDSIVSRFDLVCERRYLYDLSTVVPPLVYALLSPVAGLASDRMGRRPVTCACGCVFLAGAVGCNAAVNYPFFFINRILVLASASATYLVTFILLYEVTGKEERWLYTLLHTAVAGTIVPPIMHLLAEAKPSWMISHAFLIAPTTVYAAITFYLDESPAWLLATWRTREAEVAVLAGAKLNGMDEKKSRQQFQELLVEMNRLRLGGGSSVSVVDGIIEAVKMRRRAVAAIVSRFSASGIYFGLAISDSHSGKLWQMVHVVLSTGCYALVIRATNMWGVRDALSVLLAVTCGCTIVKAATVYGGLDGAAAYAHALMKVLVSCTMSMVMCYAGDAFPTSIRSAGVSLSVFAAGMGALVGVSVSKLHFVRKSFVFDIFSVAMTLLSAVLVQWLPEVFVGKRSKPPPEAANPEERKVAMQASLAPLEHSRKGRRRRHERRDRGKTP